MKTTQCHFHTTAVRIMLAMAILLPASLFAQTPETAPRSENEYNDDFHTFIINRLRQSVQQREKQMNKQVQQMLISLPNAEKLYDETFVRISSDVQEDTTEDGKPELNYVYNIAYNCHHFEGTEDDYPSGAYLWNSSNSCRAICNITRQMIEPVSCRNWSASFWSTA